MVDELQLITGIDLPVEELGLTLRQPRLKEIAMLGEQNYFVALQLFRMTKESLKIENPELTNWMIFQEALGQKIEGIANTRTLVSNFLQLFIIQKMTLGPRSIIIDTPEGLINIEPEQFDIFQKIVCMVGGESLLVPSEEQFKPKNKRAAEIAEKMKKARKRIAAQKPQPKSEGFLARYIKAVAVATSNSLEEVVNMTIIQLNELMQKYLAWESYDLDIRSRLAGAKGDDKLTHWIMRDPSKDNDSIGTI